MRNHLLATSDSTFPPASIPPSLNQESRPLIHQNVSAMACVVHQFRQYYPLLTFGIGRSNRVPSLRGLLDHERGTTGRLRERYLACPSLDSRRRVHYGWSGR